MIAFRASVSKITLAGVTIALLLLFSQGDYTLAQKKQPLSCKQLTGRNLVSSTKIKVAYRKGRLFGCVRGGRAYPLGAYSGPVVQVAGTFVLIEAQGGDRYGNHGIALTFADVKTGNNKVIAFKGVSGYSPFSRIEGAVIPRIFLTSKGIAAATLVTLEGRLEADGSEPARSDLTKNVEVVIFNSAGRLLTLDSATSEASLPPESLSLQGQTLGWFHDGQERTVTLN